MKPAAKITFIVVSGAVVVGSVVAAYLAVGEAKKPVLATVEVGRGDVHRTVSLSGAVKAATDVSLGFERGGRVTSVSAKVGDRVRSGQVIALVDSSDLEAQLAQARAAVDAAQARLDAIKEGARPEAVDVQDRQVSAAQGAVDDARRGLSDALHAAYVTGDDAIRGKADPAFVEASGTTPRLAFFVADSALSDDLAGKRVRAGESLAAWKASVDALDGGADPSEQTAAATRGLADAKALLDGLALALDKTVIAANPGLAQTTLDGWKANVALARTSVAAAVSSVSAASAKLRSASSALDVASSSRTLTSAGPTATDVAAQEAVLAQAKASVDAVRVQIGKTALRSPIDGVIVRQDAKVGAIAVPNAPVAGVISDGAFQIDAVVAEADVAAVAPGAKAQVTLDAYGTGAAFAATVVSVDPAKSRTDGAEGYKATLAFDAPDARIKEGMAADAEISSGDETGVIVVPRQALIMRDGSATVLVASDGGFLERSVRVGLQGSDGSVEILEGLAEGERIAAFGASR